MIPNPGEWFAGFDPGDSGATNKWISLQPGQPGNMDTKKKEAEDLQREFAKNGLQWRVADAIKAGIHPLAALGFQGPQASPVIVGDSGPPPPDPASSMASNMGIDIGRAMMASANPETRMMSKMQLASMRLDLEGKALDNQMRASKLKMLNQTGPAMPSPIDQQGGMSGQGNFKVKPSEAFSTSKGAPHQQAGAVADIGFARTSDGGYIPVPSQDVKERIEDNLFHESAHFLRNNVLPNITGGRPPDPKQYPLPKGYDEWRWSYTHQQYMPYKKEYRETPWMYHKKRKFTF